MTESGDSEWKMSGNLNLGQLNESCLGKKLRMCCSFFLVQRSMWLWGRITGGLFGIDSSETVFSFFAVCTEVLRQGIVANY